MKINAPQLAADFRRQLFDSILSSVNATAECAKQEGWTETATQRQHINAMDAAHEQVYGGIFLLHTLASQGGIENIEEADHALTELADEIHTLHIAVIEGSTDLNAYFKEEE